MGSENNTASISAEDAERFRKALITIASRRSVIFGSGTMSNNESFSIAYDALNNIKTPRAGAE